MGLGFGCLYLPAPAIVSQYFHKSTALAIGASSTGSALGTFLGEGRNDSMPLNLTAFFRGCHLPDRIYPAAAAYWLRLDCPRPGLHPFRHFSRPRARHEVTRSPTSNPGSSR